MKRFHVHLSVNDLQQSVTFYSALFASAPTIQQDDYAKWMLEDPRVNFALSTRSGTPGIDHLGIQAESDAELTELGERLARAGQAVVPEAGTECCYARSEKLWTEDPQGTRWESFHTVGAVSSYHGDKPGCEMSSARAVDLKAMAGTAAATGDSRCSAPPLAQKLARLATCCGPK